MMAARGASGGRLELAGRHPFCALHEAVIGHLREMVGVIRDELGRREHKQVKHGTVVVASGLDLALMCFPSARS
jgi:hypothetical protein